MRQEIVVLREVAKLYAAKRLELACHLDALATEDGRTAFMEFEDAIHLMASACATAKRARDNFRAWKARMTWDNVY